MPRYTLSTGTAITQPCQFPPEQLATVTLDADLFASSKVLQPGTLLAKPTTGDLWGPYASDASDGRQTTTDNLLVLFDYVDLTDGDKEVSYIKKGTCYKALVKTYAGVAITADLQDELNSKLCTVLFDEIGS